MGLEIWFYFLHSSHIIIQSITIHNLVHSEWCMIISIEWLLIFTLYFPMPEPQYQLSLLHNISKIINILVLLMSHISEWLMLIRYLRNIMNESYVMIWLRSRRFSHRIASKLILMVLGQFFKTHQFQ